MQYRKKHSILCMSVLILGSLGFGSIWEVALKDDITLLTPKKIYSAGEKVTLDFTGIPSENAVLLINVYQG